MFAADEKQALIGELTGMVRAVANRIARRVPSHVDIDDLLSAGMIGLIDALDKFDRAKASDVRKYAAIRVKGAMLDELRAQDPMKRVTRKKLNDLEHAVRAMTQTLGRPPSDDEMAAHLGMSVERYHAHRDELAPVLLTSVEGLAQAGIDVSHWMNLEGTSPQDVLEDKELRALLEGELNALPSARHQMALRFSYFDGLSNREIAKVFDVSESRASQLLSEALAAFGRRLRLALRASSRVASLAPLSCGKV